MLEHSTELQKEDLEKEILTLKEENRKLREEKVRLQTQAEDDTQVNKELQEQLSQLTKHVKVNWIRFLPLTLRKGLEDLKPALINVNNFKCVLVDKN